MGQVVDARTDIYSSGVLLYQLLTGERPFEGGMSAIMHKALNTEPPAPSQLSVTAPPAFDAVVRRAMAKRPEDRFASATAFAEAMRAALAHPAEPRSARMKRPWSPRRPSAPPPRTAGRRAAASSASPVAPPAQAARTHADRSPPPRSLCSWRWSVVAWWFLLRTPARCRPRRHGAGATPRQAAGPPAPDPRRCRVGSPSARSPLADPAPPPPATTASRGRQWSCAAAAHRSPRSHPATGRAPPFRDPIRRP